MPGDAASIEIARINAQAGLDQAGISADASRFGAKTGANAQMYGADQRFAGDQLAADTSMRNTDVDAGARRYAADRGMYGSLGMNPGADSSTTFGKPFKFSADGDPNSPYPKPFTAAKGTSRVPGQGDGTVDTVDAKLAPGEAVLNKAAAEMLGRGLIDLLNKHGMLQMGMPEPDADDMEEPEGYATGCSNVQKYATGTAYVEPLAVQRAPVPQAATFTLGMMGGNQGLPAIGGGGRVDSGAMENNWRRPAPRPMMAPPPPAAPDMPVIDHGPAAAAPDMSATAWGNRPAPAPTAPPVNSGWADAGRINYPGGQMSASAPAPAVAPLPRMINGMTGVAPQTIPPIGQRPSGPMPTNIGAPASPATPPAPNQRPEGPPNINNQMTFDQAFKAARDAFGGQGGAFDWHGKSYQTNVKGENYAKNPVKF